MMKDYEYIVLTYGPLCTAEAVGVCMVIVRELSLSTSAAIDVYVPTQNPGMLPHHWEYLMVLANEWQVLSTGIDDLLAEVQDLSIGPLRLQMTGMCRQTQLHQFLLSLFKEVKYVAMSRPSWAPPCVSWSERSMHN